jgi:hypothetical protein
MFINLDIFYKKFFISRWKNIQKKVSFY